MSAEDLSKIMKICDNAWTVVPGATPRVKFVPKNFDAATTNQGQRQ